MGLLTCWLWTVTDIGPKLDDIKKILLEMSRKSASMSSASETDMSMFLSTLGFKFLDANDAGKVHPAALMHDWCALTNYVHVLC